MKMFISQFIASSKVLFQVHKIDSNTIKINVANVGDIYFIYLSVKHVFRRVRVLKMFAWEFKTSE